LTFLFVHRSVARDSVARKLFRGAGAKVDRMSDWLENRQSDATCATHICGMGRIVMQALKGRPTLESMMLRPVPNDRPAIFLSIDYERERVAALVRILIGQGKPRVVSGSVLPGESGVYRRSNGFRKDRKRLVEANSSAGPLTR
jgi:hypothetical protein